MQSDGQLTVMHNCMDGGYDRHYTSLFESIKNCTVDVHNPVCRRQILKLDINDEWDNGALLKLIEETNALFVTDEFASNFKEISKYPKFCPSNLIKKMAATERDSVVCARDVRFLVKFYLHSTSDVRFSATSEGYEESQRLMKKYRVEKKAQADNITLHRIGAAFPIVGVSLLRQFKIDRKLSTATLKAMNADNFPWCMRTQMCLSLAPIAAEYIKDPEYQTVIFAIVVFMYYENKVINEQKHVFSPIETFEKVLNIAHAVYSDSHIDADKKKHAWNHVMFDYTENKESVNGLLHFFRLEIPKAEAAFKNRFEFIEMQKYKKKYTYERDRASNSAN